MKADRALIELPVEAEMRKEKALALKGSAERLLEALAYWRRLQVEGAEEGAVLDARKVAGRALWNIIVQREAMGLKRHDDVYRVYDVPLDLPF